jgi:3-isopropylmalate dehydrogenase
MKKYRIALLAGDGIGEEIMAEAVKILQLVSSRHDDLEFELLPAAFGASAWFSHGTCWPEETGSLCDSADAILKGTIGLSHAESKKIPADESPEKGLLAMRARYDTFANFRPVYLPGSLAHFSPLKPEIIGDGIDIMILRELVGGLYFGEKETGVNEQGLRYAREQLVYDEYQIRRIVEVAFQTAMKRRRKLHSVHKSNVLKSSVLWTGIVEEVSVDYPEVEVNHLLVDAAATYLCLKPTAFDVMVMENLFGDILSDQAGGILGSLGLMPSACIGPEKSYYEPSHGSAPDIAGQNIANPYSMIGSVAMMLEMSFGMDDEAGNLWQAMQSVFAAGYSTPDLSRPGAGVSLVGTREFGDRVAAALAEMPV